VQYQSRHRHGRVFDLPKLRREQMRLMTGRAFSANR